MKIYAPANVVIAWCLIVSALALPATAATQATLKEYHDKQYGYSFQYPVDWQLIDLPEGRANPNMRFILQGIEGSSFMVVVEQKEGKTVRANSAEVQRGLVAQLMTQTIEQIYRRITLNLKATAMTVGERRDLTNDVCAKFYIATLHKMPAGKPVIVAGIHALPFGKNYAVNFIMNAFWDGKPGAREKILLGVFNSFRLVDEAQKTEKPQEPKTGGVAE